MSFLSEKEQILVDRFLKDEAMVQAVRKVLLKTLYYHGILEAGKEAPNSLENFALNTIKSQISGDLYSDEELGKMIKLKRMSLELLETAFNELKTYKIVEQKEESPPKKIR